jgi:hypothetical protein
MISSNGNELTSSREMRLMSRVFKEENGVAQGEIWSPQKRSKLRLLECDLEGKRNVI